MDADHPRGERDGELALRFLRLTAGSKRSAGATR
jgi:hypothetical protein